MPAFPTYDLSPQEIKVRYGEPYVSEAINQKFMGVPRGVYLGFDPTLNNNVLTLSPDVTYGVSLLRVTSGLDAVSVDLVTDATVTLDFTGHTVFPVYVIGSADQQLGAPTTGSITTSAAPPSGPTQVLICVLTSLSVVNADPPTNRDTPFAYASAPLGFGFMREGAVEQLLQVIAATAEVVAARVDTEGMTQPNLGTRITADGAGASMASRLRRTMRTVVSNDYTMATTTDQLSVADSFSALTRSASPIENIAGFGSDSFQGALTDGTPPSFYPVGAARDTIRNVVIPVDASTGKRLTDSGGEAVFGRLSLSAIVSSGTSNFAAASTTVTGVGTSFDTEFADGDTIEDGLGNIYLVVGPPGPTTMTISPAALGNAAVIGAIRNRYTVQFLRRSGGSDISSPVDAGTTLRFYFSMWRGVGSGFYDEQSRMYAGGEPPQVPIAAVGVPGRVLLAPGAPDGLAGALRTVQDTGSPVGSGNVHTLNFLSALDGGGGVLSVTQAGPTGVPGPGGALAPPGPPGAPGPTGPGLNSFVYLTSPVFDHLSLGPGTIYSWDGSVAGEARFVHYGLKRASWPPVIDSNDGWNITNVQAIAIGPSSSTIRMTAQVPLGAFPSGFFQYFMVIGGL